MPRARPIHLALLAFALGCVRCSGCLPPLISDDSQLAPLPAPQVPGTGDLPTPNNEVPSTQPTAKICSADSDCTGLEDKCCAQPHGGAVCGRCCQNSDCATASTPGIVCDTAARVCVTCSRLPASPAQCSAGETCCVPGTGGNSSSTNACIPGACCTDTDCAQSADGPFCLDHRCTLGSCSGEGQTCHGSGLCCSGLCLKDAACCSRADCGNGQVCTDGACAACDAQHPCDAGEVCCGGSCVSGTCCESNDCADTTLACTGNVCGACVVGANDCRSDQTCCDHPTSGPTCIGQSECCPDSGSNDACDANGDPKLRACGFATRECGACDPVTAPCAAGKVCCGGGCVAPGGAPRAVGEECCSDSDCSSGACDTTSSHCVECKVAGTCGTATGAQGREVCDTATRACVACDGSHPCGAGLLCCNGLCFAGTCCADGDCARAAPVCDTSTHACRTCSTDGDCGAGNVCVAATGDGPCPGVGQGCSCQSGSCHETAAPTASDCSGACCSYQCSIGGDCCDNADCTMQNFGYDPAAQCTSARTAPPVAVCGATHRCGCPAPTTHGFVDVSIGDDLVGNGSAACPFRTLTKALTALPGLIINVRPGRYAANETFPLDVPANTTLQRDPTCGTDPVIVVRTDSDPTCPVQRGTGAPVSCAIGVRHSGVQLRGLNVKNLHGRAVAVGGGANATTVLDSGVLGCESSALGACNRGGPESRQDLEPLFVGGNATPVIGPATIGALTFGGSLGSAIVIADSAHPTIRNIDSLVGYDDDVVRILDAGRANLSGLRINWPGGPTTANTRRCVSVSGTGGAISLDDVRVAGCGTGGIIVTRAPGADAVPHTFTNVWVESSGGLPQGTGTDVNRREGFGLWLSATQGVSEATIVGGRFASNRGHGIVVQDASVGISGSVSENNGQQSVSGTNCFGGNGLELLSTRASAVVDNASFVGSKGRTSPPPAGPSTCATGNGVHVQNGTLTMRSSRATGNQFDGLFLDSGTISAIVQDDLFMANGANGIETQVANVQLGSCTNGPCVGGNNRFRECPAAGGNGRANLCFVTTAVVFAPPVLPAQNNRWLAEPADVVGDDNPPAAPGGPRDLVIYNPFGGANLHCGGLGTHDVIIVSSPASFFGLGPSVVTLNPTQTPLSCP